jgi:choline dehydrogenase
VTAPRSRGSIRLACPDPAVPPLIDPGFLTDPDGTDLERLAAGLGIIRRAVVGPVMTRLGISETWPGLARRGSLGLRQAVRGSVSSYWHPAGTCAIGPVVDPQLRVHGIARLRVCDASVFPLIPNAPLHATVLAVAERAAALIAGTP